MQPICFKIVNSTGFGDYQNGLTPTTPFVENLGNLGVLGDATEPLLSTAIAQITGVGRRSMQHPDEVYEHFKDRKSMQRFGTEMYIDKVPDGITDFFKF
ncbi:hypothetical protein D3C86_1356040 [compost metagenome]